jgi:hypothetical protein
LPCFPRHGFDLAALARGGGHNVRSRSRKPEHHGPPKTASAACDDRNAA